MSRETLRGTKQWGEKERKKINKNLLRVLGEPAASDSPFGEFAGSPDNFFLSQGVNAAIGG